MASRCLEESYFSAEYPLAFPETFLPSFPDEELVQDALPEILPVASRLGKAGFLNWIDFTLENPDQIWETEAPDGDNFYHYLNFVEEGGDPPVFVVEVRYCDDLMEVNNYCLLVKESELARLRKGKKVFCRASDWEKEKLIRELNDTALSKYDQDCLEEARQLIDVAISLSGAGCAYLFNNRGLICWKMGKTDQAKRDFLQSISLDEQNGDPYFNIGLIYFDELDYSKALRYLRRAVEINPTDSQFLTELGHLYLEIEREPEALRLFKKALENNPKDAQVDFHLGYYFLYKKREPRHALKHYHQGLKKDPQDQFALADVAIAHWALGNKRKSLEIHRNLQHSPCLMPYTISRLVYLNVEMGDYESALKYYRQALSQKEPFEPEWLHYHAALVYANTGRLKQALDILNLAVKAGGEAVIKRAMSDKALRTLKQIPDFKKLIKLTGKRRTR
ncbi:MAG: tetratricopeptide repeat protein [Desulfomonile tiedjei]|nr:tetratricopeptide repeat protein [Desulfomonile tiedjei]